MTEEQTIPAAVSGREPGSAWGLWHEGRNAWIKTSPAGSPRQFATKALAAACKIQITKGKRDELTNYFRISVYPRQFETVAKKAPSVVHVWGIDGGGLDVDGKKVSDYYTVVQSDIVEALGYTAEARELNADWYKGIITLPDHLDECVFQQNNPAVE